MDKLRKSLLLIGISALMFIIALYLTVHTLSKPPFVYHDLPQGTPAPTSNSSFFNYQKPPTP